MDVMLNTWTKKDFQLVFFKKQMMFFTKYLIIQNTTSVMLRMLIPVNSPNVPPVMSTTENEDKHD